VTLNIVKHAYGGQIDNGINPSS